MPRTTNAGGDAISRPEQLGRFNANIVELIEVVEEFKNDDGRQGVTQSEVWSHVVGDLSSVIKSKPRRDIASRSRIARPFSQEAKLNDSFPSSAACAVHTAYTPPP